MMFQVNTLYSQVKSEISRRIHAGVYATGKPLPNEFVLSQEFGVSIGTIRRAVEQLVSEHYLVRQQGRGTFVHDRRSLGVRPGFDPIKNRDGSDIAWKFLHADIQTTEATPRERRVLELADDETKVHRITRAREADGAVVMHEICVIPASRLKVDENLDSGDTRIVALANGNGVAVAGVEKQLVCVGADAGLAELFEIEPDSPLLKLQIIVWDARHRPLEWRTAHCCLRDKVYVEIYGDDEGSRARSREAGSHEAPARGKSRNFLDMES